MREILNSFVTWFFRTRIKEVEYAMNYAQEVQQNTFNYLLKRGMNTEYGKKHGFKGIDSYDKFRGQLPLHDYESIKPYIDRILKGEQNLLWDSDIRWFAKSSGTTSDKSKFIPVSYEALEECQYKGGRDMLTMYCHNHPENHIFEGKGLLIGGSHQINQLNPKSYYGDLSAVMMNNLPFWVNIFSTPGMEIALMDNWEEKLDKMAQATIDEDVTNISGVPTWTLVLMRRLMEMKGVKTIHEIWPRLELFMHGGVSFEPYRNEFKQLIPSGKMNFMESYNASEGFFGIQDRSDHSDMLLMTDYGVFYEFIPIDELGKENPKVLWLDEIEIGQTYALVITTNSGLWRYQIGDTISFTEKTPYRFKIKGRTKSFINAFGEELMVANADAALQKVCAEEGLQVVDYTAGPVYLNDGKAGCHEWIIEFVNPPAHLQEFTLKLDRALKEENSDYEAKRAGNLALEIPKIHIAPPQLFYNWLKAKNKLGGQHKIPRLCNDRDLLETLLGMMEASRIETSQV